MSAFIDPEGEGKSKFHRPCHSQAMDSGNVEEPHFVPPSPAAGRPTTQQIQEVLLKLMLLNNPACLGSILWLALQHLEENERLLKALKDNIDAGRLGNTQG